MYKLVNNPNGPQLVKKTEPNRDILIPFMEENSDYQEYLKWVAEGGVPEPADE
jgi:hypothetical protein